VAVLEPKRWMVRTATARSDRATTVRRVHFTAAIKTAELFVSFDVTRKNSQTATIETPSIYYEDISLVLPYLEQTVC